MLGSLRVARDYVGEHLDDADDVGVERQSPFSNLSELVFPLLNRLRSPRVERGEVVEDVEAAIQDKKRCHAAARYQRVRLLR